MKTRRNNPKLVWILWLPPLVLLANLAVLGLIITYSSLNLRPYTPPHDPSQVQTARQIGFYLVILLPVTASVIYLWPIFTWLRGVWGTGQGQAAVQAPATVVVRAANSPVTLAAFSLLSWALMEVLLIYRLLSMFEEITLGLWAHFVVRPLLAGLIAAAAVFFMAEFICRTRAWPALFGNTQIEGNQRLWKIRVVHRLLLLWLAISFLPLSAVALTAFIRMDTVDLAADPLLFRVLLVIVIIGTSAALGGAVLAWLLSRSISQPLRALEALMARPLRIEYPGVLPRHEPAPFPHAFSRPPAQRNR